MSRAPLPTWCFSLVVIKSGRRLLLVQEPKGWTIPGGRIHPGESFAEAAVRFAHDEAGLPVELEGLLRMQHTPVAAGEARVRVCFLARPVDDRAPKVREKSSLVAQWFTREEMLLLTFRSDHVMGLLTQALEGPVYPLAALDSEV